MTFAPEEAAGEALRRQFRRTLRRAERRFKAALAHDVASAHRARRHLKSLRSLLILMRPAIGRRKSRQARDIVRAAAHALAGRRRDQAMVEIAAKMADHVAGDPVAARLWSKAGAALAERRARNAGRSLEIAGAAECRQALKRLRREAKRWSLPRRREGFIFAGMTHAYSRSRRHLRSGLRSRNVAELHRARRFAIYQLHHLEWAAAVWPAVMAAWVGELERLRGLLGDLHDLHELTDLLQGEGLPGLDRCDATGLLSHIDQRGAEVTDEIRAAALRLYAEKPAAYGLRMRRLWQAHRSQRDRDSHASPPDPAPEIENRPSH